MTESENPELESEETFDPEVDIAQAMADDTFEVADEDEDEDDALEVEES